MQKPYVLKREGVEGDYLKFSFESDMLLTEEYLEREVRRAKNVRVPKLATFLSYLRSFNRKKDHVQVYMEKPFDSTTNTFLASRFFTTGLRAVRQGEKHQISNDSEKVPIFVYKLEASLPSVYHVTRLSSYIIPMKEALIRNVFSQDCIEPKQVKEFDEGSVYFFYTITHSLFRIRSLTREAESATAWPNLRRPLTNCENFGGPSSSNQLSSAARPSSNQLSSATGPSTDGNTCLAAQVESNTAQINSHRIAISSILEALQKHMERP